MKTNELTLFFLSFLYLIPVLISDNILFDIFILIIAFLNLVILKKVRYKLIFYFLLIIILPLISVFVTTLVYTKPTESSEEILLFNFINTNKYALELALFLTVRTFSLSFISFSYLVALEYDNFIVSLMQNMRLPVTVGYSLLVTFNAFYHLKDEFVRIKNAYMMRFGKKRNALLLFFPMIVSAARYAYYAGLSLESRGLNKNKTYLKNMKLQKKDFIIIIINFFILFGMFFVFLKKIKIKLM